MQLFFKKTINMFYGCIASQYFEINNLNLANNITGLAKIGVWILAKSLNLCQTITDGGIYTPSKVEYFWAFKNVKKPSINKLFDNIIKQEGSHFLPLGFLKNGEKRKYIPDYEKYFKRIMKSNNIEYSMEKFSLICDKLAREHVKSFCLKYGIENDFIYELSHKPDNTFSHGCTLNRGHYFLINLCGKEIAKVRGHQQKKNKEAILSPIFKILRGKALNEDVYLDALCSTQISLLKKKELVEVRKKKLVSPRTGIHDSYISKRLLSIKLDCGKFSTFANYKNNMSAFVDNYRYEFLNYCEVQENRIYFKSESFWKNYHLDLEKF